MITFQNIQKVYEKDGQSLVALQDINLHINKGDIFGFIIIAERVKVHLSAW